MLKHVVVLLSFVTLGELLEAVEQLSPADNYCLSSSSSHCSRAKFQVDADHVFRVPVECRVVSRAVKRSKTTTSARNADTSTLFSCLVFTANWQKRADS
ncbi:hypothetical protein V9T40_010597 [Parthenolecanium corni]|uniref:Secreted protein n=1 Tax=Parthenolecanium corni TaxID=536013 RepID=A0AAN9TIB0_9HEMI